MEEEASAPPAAPSSVAERKGVDVEQPTSEGRPLEEERPLEHEVEKALLILSSQIEGAFPGHSSEAKANIFKEEPGPTQKEESLSDGALDFSFSALGGDLVAEETLSEESFFRGNSFVPQASRRFLDSQAERFLLLGTANFLSALGKTLDLQADVVALALRIFFSAGEAPAVRRNRKASAAAALLLAWKHVEDADASRSQRRLHAIFRAFFRVSVREHALQLGSLASQIGNCTSAKAKRSREERPLSEAEPRGEGVWGEEGSVAEKVASHFASSSRWFARDCGSGSRDLSLLLKTCELQLLQFIHFDLGSPRSAFSELRRHCRLFLSPCRTPSAGHLKKTFTKALDGNAAKEAERKTFPGCRCCRAWPSRGREAAALLEALCQRSAEELLNLHHSPLVLEFSSAELAGAAPVVAAVSLNLPLLGLVRGVEDKEEKQGKGEERRVSGAGVCSAEASTAAADLSGKASGSEKVCLSASEEGAEKAALEESAKPNEGGGDADDVALGRAVVCQLSHFESHVRLYLAEAASFALPPGKLPSSLRERNGSLKESPQSEPAAAASSSVLKPRVLRQVLRLAQMTRVWQCALEHSRPRFTLKAASTSASPSAAASHDSSAEEKGNATAP